MPNTALNRTTQVLLTNKSGGNLVYGDVVVLDNTNANGFTTTTSAGLSTRGLGVILEPNGIANNASGMVAIGGWCPKINLNTAAAVGQFVKTHTVAGQGTPHASPQAEGDFAVALSASATPACNLFGSPNGPLAGGSGTVTNTGTLTSGKTIIGNGTADVTVSSLTAQFVGSSSGTAAAASMTTARLLGRTTASSGAVEEITVGTGLTLSAGSLTVAGTGGLFLVEQHTASSSASLNFTTGITSTYDDYVFRIVGLLPATNAVNLTMLVSTDGGSTWLGASNYAYNLSYVTAVGTGGVAETSAGAASFFLAGTIDSATSTSLASGEVELFNPLSSTRRKGVHNKIEYYQSGNFIIKTGGGAILTTTAVNAVQFIMSSGNIAEGTIRLYGYAK